MSESVWIALGANLGDPRAQLDGAVERLAADPRLAVLRTSARQWTDPVGGPPGQPKYLNGVLEARWDGEPLALLELLQNVEAQFGRTRAVVDGPRTLDLDLLLFGDRTIDGPRLTVPHPRLADRRFVLEPLASLAPDLRPPGLDASVGALLARLPVRSVGIRQRGRRPAHRGPRGVDRVASRIPDP